MQNVKSDSLQALILTKNEEPNIQRVLDKLTWIERVLVIDSHSTDNTVEIMESYPNVKIIYRKFDTFAQQCNYGLEMLSSKWVLSLDADYVLTDGFIEETKQFVMHNSNISGYYTKFDWIIYGKKLRSNNTTPRAVLFKRGFGKYYDDGHAHRLNITGETQNYKHKILHDDRKSLSRWINNQDGYSIKECDKLLSLNSSSQNSALYRIRRTKILAPFLVFFYCLFMKGLILDGWAGWYYTLQRTMVEMLFILRLIEAENFKK